MTINSWPFEDQSTTEFQFSRLSREWQSNGVVGSMGGDDLRVVPTTSDPNSVTVRAGYGIVRGHMINVLDDTVRTLSAVPGGTGGQRIDSVVLRLDPDANQISLVVIEGTATTAPTLTQTSGAIFEELLATVTVDTAGNVSVVDKRHWVGGNVGAWSNATRPSSPRSYTSFGYNTSISDYEYWDGSSWVSLRGGDTGWVSPAITALGGHAFVSARARQAGKHAEVYLNLTIKSTIDVSGTGNIGNTAVCTVPAPYRPTNPLGATLVSAATGRLVVATINTAGQVSLTSTVPNVDFAVNESISLHGTWFCK